MDHWLLRFMYGAQVSTRPALSHMYPGFAAQLKTDCLPRSLRPDELRLRFVEAQGLESLADLNEVDEAELREAVQGSGMVRLDARGTPLPAREGHFGSIARGAGPFL